MDTEVQTDISERGSHVVAYATGDCTQAGMKAKGAELAARWGIPRPKVEIIFLNAAQRSSNGKCLIAVTQDNR